MTLDEMFAQPGLLVAAWDLQDDRKTLRVYRVGEAGATFVGRTEIAPDEREMTNNQLFDHGLRIGYAYYDFIWALDDAGCAVWTKRAQLVDGTREEIRIGGHCVRASEIATIEVFVSPDNMGHRGVRLDVDGRSVVVAEENFSVESNPTYGEMDLDWEIAWAEFLGLDLALWLRRPYSDRHGRITNQRQRDIHEKCCELADKVASGTPRGEFEEVWQTLGPIEAPGAVVLRFAANTLEDEGRFLEQKVFTPSGKSWYGRWLKMGTNRQIAAYLRDVRTPTTIMINARELRRKLVEDQYA
jgi:hypothetical protein